MNRLKIVLHHAGCILSVLLVVLLAGVTVSGAADLTKVVPTAPKEQAPSETMKSESPKKTIPNLITYTTRLSEELIDLNSLLADITPPDKAMEALPGIKDALNSLNWEAMMQEADSCCRASAITMSFWPRWTPSAPTARATSTWSLMISGTPRGFNTA